MIFFVAWQPARKELEMKKVTILQRKYKAVTPVQPVIPVTLASPTPDLVFDLPYTECTVTPDVREPWRSFAEIENKLYAIEEEWLRTYETLLRLCSVKQKPADLRLFLECNKDRVVYPTDGTLVRSLADYTKHWITFVGATDVNVVTLIPTVNAVWPYTTLELLNVCKVLHTHKRSHTFGTIPTGSIVQMLKEKLASPTLDNEVQTTKTEWHDTWQIACDDDITGKVRRLADCYLALLSHSS